MKKSKDQDIFYYFFGLYDNPDTRHFLVDNFRRDYELVSLNHRFSTYIDDACQLYKRLEDNFGLQNLVTVCLTAAASSNGDSCF